MTNQNTSEHKIWEAVLVFNELDNRRLEAAEMKCKSCWQSLQSADKGTDCTFRMQVEVLRVR